MKKLYKFLICITAFLLLLSVPVQGAEIKFPSPTNLKYVNDYVGVLNEETKRYVVSVGKELEDKTGAQVTTVIISSLEGIDIETYANKLFRNWGIGQKEKNNGLLILISMQDRLRRVEVGNGLEGAIPDTLSDRIMEKLFKPAFKAGDYNKGIRDSYSAFADAVAKEYNVTLDKNKPVSLKETTSSTNKKASKVPEIIIGILVLDFLLNRGRLTKSLLELMFWSSFFGGRGGRGGPGGFGGGGFGGGSPGGSDGFGGFGGGSSSGGGSSGNW